MVQHGFSFAAIGGVPIVAAIGGMLGWRWAFSIIGLVLLALAAGMQLWFPRIPPMVVGTSVVATYQAVWGVHGLLALLGANLMERSLFTMVTIYLPAFLMLSYHMRAPSVWRRCSPWSRWGPSRAMCRADGSEIAF